MKTVLIIGGVTIIALAFLSFIGIAIICWGVAELYEEY